MLKFIGALTEECARGIEAMDMGPAYIAAVQKGLTCAAIVFDRFHVMQMFSKVARDCRRAELKAARIKQNIKIKTFYGTSENALKTQIMIAYLLLHLASRIVPNNKTLQQVARLVATNLMIRRDFLE